jgi:hypothetical protein
LSNIDNLIELPAGKYIDLPGGLSGERGTAPAFVYGIARLYAKWADFFIKNPQPTKEQVLAFASRLHN